jgi:predicted porin
VVIGRSFTTVYDTVIAFDPMGFAPFYSWATSGPATGPSKYGFTTQYDNIIKYAAAGRLEDRRQLRGRRADHRRAGQRQSGLQHRLQTRRRQPDGDLGAQQRQHRASHRQPRQEHRLAHRRQL